MSIENKLTPNAKYLLEKRYLRRDKEGNIIETPDGMIRRVCKHIAQAEEENALEWEEKFYNIISDLYFMPASPILFNSGTSMGLLSSCFIIPIKDDIEDIFEKVKNVATISKCGGGVGANFSKIRPEGFPVGDMRGVACFTGDQKVLTKRGLIQIKDIIPGEDIAITPNGEFLITHLYKNGLKDVIEVEFNDGRKIKCTENHRFVCLNNETIEFEKIPIIDIYNSNEGINGLLGPECNIDTDCNDVKIKFLLRDIQYDLKLIKDSIKLK